MTELRALFVAAIALAMTLSGGRSSYALPLGSRVLAEPAKDLGDLVRVRAHTSRTRTRTPYAAPYRSPAYAWGRGGGVLLPSPRLMSAMGP